MATEQSSNEELIRLIVEEVDEARETLELASQLQRALPLKSMADVARATKGQILFRGNSFDVRMFESLIPELVFPIEDVGKLVRLVYQIVLAAPRTVTYDLANPVNAKREMNRAVLRRLVSDGEIGPLRSPNSTILASIGDRSRLNREEG